MFVGSDVDTSGFDGCREACAKIQAHQKLVVAAAGSIVSGLTGVVFCARRLGAGARDAHAGKGGAGGADGAGPVTDAGEAVAVAWRLSSFSVVVRHPPLFWRCFIAERS